MLPNTQKLTSQMAMMPDAALKQMAMMHKNDPYTLPLIIAEDSRRKEMRQAAMTRMATPQPNVADQQIAQIGTAPQMPMPQGAQQQLPENHGIGALNAPNLERMADGGIAGYAGDDESLVHLSPFAMKQIMGDMATSGAGVNANADLGEAGRLSGGVNLNRMDKDRESRQMQALMANYMNNIGEVGINANVSRPLERGLPSDFYQTNLMGSVPVGEGRLTIGKHGTHAGGEHHTNAHSIGYNTPFEGGRLNANINKPVEGRPSFGVQYNRAFADGGVAGYADGGQQPGMFNYAQMAPAVDLHPNSGVTPRSMAGGGMAHFKKGGALDEYADYIREAATSRGMDPDLAMRLFKTESGGDRYAESGKGAVGLGQLMPAASKEMGLDPKDRTNPYKNIDASIGYFMKQMGKYKDPAKAAAAYNWGGGNLDKHLAENKGELNPTGLPKETANYLTKLVPGGVAIAKTLPKDTSTAGMIPGQNVKAPAAIPEEKGFFGKLGDKMGLSPDTQRNLSNLNNAMAGATGATYIPSYLAKAPSGIATLGEKIYNKFVPATGMSAKEIEAMRAANMAQEAGSAVRGAQEAGATVEEQNYLRNMMEANQKAGMPSKALEIQNAGTLREANDAARLKQIADQGRVGTQSIAGLNATVPTNPSAPEDRTITRDDDMSPEGEIKQGIPEKAKESFMDMAKAELTPKKAKGLSDDDLLAFGLGLMASKSPNALTAAGEAGLGALAMKREQQKTEREDMYRQALAREANAKASNLESGGSNTAQAMHQADVMYDNWLKSLNKMDAMSLTPEMQRAKQDEFLQRAFQAFRMAPPAGIGSGTATAGAQSDPLGLRKS